VKVLRHRQNRKYLTYRNAARDGPTHSHSEVQPCDFRVMRADRHKTDRQTDKQTNRLTGILITVLHAPPASEENICLTIWHCCRVIIYHCIKYNDASTYFSDGVTNRYTFWIINFRTAPHRYWGKPMVRNKVIRNTYASRSRGGS